MMIFILETTVQPWLIKWKNRDESRGEYQIVANMSIILQTKYISCDHKKTNLDPKQN